MTREELENENILYLTVGKEVKMQFDEDENLDHILLSTNKIAELFSNGLLDETTIFDVTVLGLITKSNFKTYVRVNDQKKALNSKADYKYLYVDKEKTKQHKKNQYPARPGNFLFFVAEDEKYPRGHMVQLFNPNKNYRKR